MLPHQGSGAGQAIEVRANVNRIGEIVHIWAGRVHSRALIRPPIYDKGNRFTSLEYL